MLFFCKFIPIKKRCTNAKVVAKQRKSQPKLELRKKVYKARKHAVQAASAASVIGDAGLVLRVRLARFVVR